MLASLLLAAAVHAAPVPALRQESWDEPAWEEEARRPRLLLSVWGGDGWLAGGTGRSAPSLGAEVAWAFPSMDVGLAALAVRGVRDEAPSAWARAAVVRLTRRFPTRRGFEAAFAIGLGAARAPDWIPWYQVALGVRVPLGPLFLGGELSFEQLDLLRLAGGLGVAF